MEAYIYQADIYCKKCAKKINRELGEKDRDLGIWTSSDEGPKGPYEDGGGESDCPQHCARCCIFLENPLTADGYKYVKDALFEAESNGEKIDGALKTWKEFYGPDGIFA